MSQENDSNNASPATTGRVAHAEYVQILQGKHPAYRFGSDRIANANSFLFQNAESLLDFTSNGEFHPDVDESIRIQAKARRDEQARKGIIEAHTSMKAHAIHCPNCGALAGTQTAAANDVRTLQEQVEKERSELFVTRLERDAALDSARKVVALLSGSHIQANKHRLGALGSLDIDAAIIQLMPTP